MLNEKGEIHTPTCYGCCPTNPIGLRVRFEMRDGRVEGEFTSSEHHVGPPGAVHGGVIAALMDEALSFLCRSVLKWDVRTLREEITFRNSSPIGERIHVEAHIEEEKKRRVFAKARVYSDEHTVAEAMGTLFKVKGTL
jgi:acyl-coenzyme A thioesterase PaaI-like protein